MVFRGICSRISFTFLVVLVAAACGSKDGGGEPHRDPIGHIQLDGHLTEAERSNLARAVDYLTTLPPQSPKLTPLMGLNDLSGSGLRQWLEDRVGYILDSDYNFEASVHVIRNSYAYENPLDIPTLDPSQGILSTGTVAEIMMSNAGAAYYLEGKRRQFLIGFHVPGVGDVPLTSPRTGLIQMGPGLGLLKTQRLNLAGSIYVLSILFHEARHSDGHGQTAAFLHSICPAGHKYAGYYACDRSLNGPYSVQKEFLKTLAETCSACSAAQKENLQAEAMDSESRILPGEKTTMWADAPEGHR